MPMRANVLTRLTSLIILTAIGSAGADESPGLPVREVTVFKDGHALVTHEGSLTTDDQGNAVIDYVPTPVIGTFWAHCAEKSATLRSVASGTHKVTKTRSAKETKELLQANVGQRVSLRDSHDSSWYSATILKADPESSIVLLRTDHGTRVLPLNTIHELTFLEEPRTEVAYQEDRHQLRLKLDWGKRKPAATARIGMSYLQRGIRWIPGYRLHLQKDGTVKVTLQATLLNEMTDLQDVTVNLLVGVPTFDFKGTIDPIAARDAVQQLSAYFGDASGRQNSPMSGNFRNAVMLNQQVARMGDLRQPVPAADRGQLGPDIDDAGAREDLFVYTVNKITLARGERMIVQVGEWEMKYEDVYQLKLPSAPPREIRRHFNTEQQRRLAELYHAPKVKHVVRLTNSSNVPLTTAPALFVNDESVLGQGMMTFTSSGGRVDVPLTTAINVAVAHEENEVRQQVVKPKSGSAFTRFDYAGEIRLNNFHEKAVKLEVVRDTIGEMDSAGADGKISKPSLWTSSSDRLPEWWRWYSWPRWWYVSNTPGRAEWKLTVDAGEQLRLPYRWHYVWR